MGIKTQLVTLWAKKRYKQIQRHSVSAIEDQDALLKKFIKKASNTLFGKEHKFEQLKDYNSFRDAVLLRSYEEHEPYIQKIRQGAENILWQGRPMYWAKTSGTTSGSKFIPITKDSLPNHIETARDLLFCYIAQIGNARFMSGKMIFLSGSPSLVKDGDIAIGRLSGIVQNHIPSFLKSNNLPSYKTNCIPEWEKKLDAIIEETRKQNMTLISGIPPWVLMYFDRLEEKVKQPVADIFPNLRLLVHGGTNIQSYRNRLLDNLGADVHKLETFPASEGFFAYQDSLEQETLLLNTNNGIFFEFVPLDELSQKNTSRIPLSQVEVNVNYALFITTNAGLWGYDMGDVVCFTSTEPYRLVVKGRTTHFLSAFGEHVIAEEVESSMVEASAICKASVAEFTVAPFIHPTKKASSYHEWVVEFITPPASMDDFAGVLNEKLCAKNVYYDDLIKGKIIDTPRITPVPRGAFHAYMKSIGKLGGQNKIPHLKNDPNIVDALKKNFA